MKIKRLTLHNFGVYAGTNEFIFEGKKPIVLIGGLNGRGKTTFLEAILLALYGANSFAYQESKYSTYGNYLKSYVNQSDSTFDTYVEMEFVMSAEEKDSYKIKRSWNGLSQRIHEAIVVEKDGIADDFLTQNWGMFIENILPSALSNFFFFDGEKIAEIAVDNTDEQLKDSIRSMLGLAVLDRLSSDIQRTVRKNVKSIENNSDMAEVEKLQKDKERLSLKLDDIDSKITVAETEIQELEDSNEKDQLDYSSHGGDIVEQRHETLEKRAVIKEKINQLEQRFVECSAQSLPFSMVMDLIDNVVIAAEEEKEQRSSKEVADRITELYKQYAKENGSEIDKDFLQFVKHSVKSKKSKMIYGLESQTLYSIIELQKNRLPNEIGQVGQLLEDYNNLKKQADELDSYLMVDINEKELKKLYKKIREREQKILSKKAELGQLKQERSSVNGELIRVSSELSKMTEQLLSGLESKDDNERFIKYSQMALKVIDSYTIKLQKRKVDELSSQVTDCYKMLASKKSLIDHIEMNPQSLNITYVNSDGDEVNKSSLSAGEKQLMVISILWALAICSKKKLPVIIDTPLSRLDSNHRKSIIKKYFPKASEQTIILSTDSEIDQGYYEMMKKNIGDEFTLIYDDDSKCTTIKKGYLIG